MSRTSSGARVVFRINDEKIAYANAITYKVMHNHDVLHVIDQLEAVEYAESTYTVSFTATMFRVSNQSAIALGLRPNVKDILTQPELTAEMRDEITGQTLFKMERVKCLQEDFTIDSRGLGQLTLNFAAIRMTDEGS